MPKNWSRQESSLSKTVFQNALTSNCVQSIELIRSHLFGVNIICNTNDITQDPKSAGLAMQLELLGFPQYGLRTLSSGDIESADHEKLVKFLLAIATAEGIARREFQEIFDDLEIWEEDIEEMYPSELLSKAAAADIKPSKMAPPPIPTTASQLTMHGVFNTHPHHPIGPIKDNYLSVQSHWL